FEQHLDADRGDLVRLDEVGPRRIGGRNALRARDRIDVLAGRSRGLVLVDLYVDLVLADADPVAREQPLRIAAADRLVGIVDVNAVRRRVDDVVAARSIVDARVPARYLALSAGQTPVALRPPPGAAALRR